MMSLAASDRPQISICRFSVWLYAAISPYAPKRFLGKTPWAFRAIGMLRQCSFFRHEISPSNISKTVWPRITKFYTVILTDILYSQTEYDVIICFQSEVIGENSRKYRLLRLRCNFLRTVQARIMGTSGSTNLPEMASLAPSDQLQNAIKYYRKVLKTGLKCRKRLINRKWCEIRQKIGVATAASKASSHFSSEEYRQSFRIKRRGVLCRLLDFLSFSLKWRERERERVEQIPLSVHHHSSKFTKW